MCATKKLRENGSWTPDTSNARCIRSWSSPKTSNGTRRYGIFNKKKFGSGDAPSKDDRVTKFFYGGEAYDGTVARTTHADVRHRWGGKVRRMKLWKIDFDDGDRAELSEIEAIAARQAYVRGPFLE